MSSGVGAGGDLQRQEVGAPAQPAQRPAEVLPHRPRPASPGRSATPLDDGGVAVEHRGEEQLLLVGDVPVDGPLGDAVGLGDGARRRASIADPSDDVDGRDDRPARQGPAFVPALSARGNLHVLARLRPNGRVAQVLEVVGLTGRDAEPVRRFSPGRVFDVPSATGAIMRWWGFGVC